VFVRVLAKMLKKKDIDDAVVSFIGNIFYLILMIAVLIASMSQLGVDTTSLIAVLGAAGLAIGLALQGSLSNFASGVLIVVLRPFRAGDFVEAGGKMGIVMKIELFSTTMRTPDNKILFIPNSKITSDCITNFSRQDTRRIDLVIGVSYDADLKVAKQTLTDVLEAEDRILPDPAYVIAVNELADSSVNFIVRPWVKAEDYWPTHWDLMEKIKIALDDAGVGIPYPQMDVHLHKNDD
jgi:small conductance mechanosensitive channel